MNRRRQLMAALAAVTVLGLSAALPSQADPVKPADQIDGAASQRQISLAEAVRKQSSRKVSKAGQVTVGERKAKSRRVTEKPVRREKTDKLAGSRKATSADVFANESAKYGGCRLDYGIAGQCLPATVPAKLARAGKNKKVWTCAQVRQLFPAGIALRTAGIDPLKLDRDRDGTACDADE